MKLSIVTPVYHEEDNIIRAIEGIRAAVQMSYEFLIIYDKPDDPTYDVVQKYLKKHKDVKHIRMVRNDVNGGRGFLNALRTGFNHAQGDAVLVMMADLCDDPKDIDKMYDMFKDADIVCASRYVAGGRQIGSPIIKRTLSRMAGVSLYVLGRLPVHDVTNNFKMYRRSMLKAIELAGEGGFEIAMEITTKAHRAGYRIVELPTTWRDREAGEAKFNLKKMLPRYLRWYWFALKPRWLGQKSSGK
ncbi:MAG TPA: glycosyltransferase [Ktedonobacteraceae bacterium]|nr:glycosyltransferase [Ktedonobacteraceae bacterium]